MVDIFMLVMLTGKAHVANSAICSPSLVSD